MLATLAAFRHAIETASPFEFFLWMSFIWGGALVLVSVVIHCLHRISVIRDTPVSKIRSAAQGFVQILGHGEAIPGQHVVAPLSHKPCIWWSYTITQAFGINNNMPAQGDNQYEFVEKTSVSLLQVSDGTGTCLIDPAFAEVTPAVEDVWYGKTRDPDQPCAHISASFKFVEKRIHAGDMLHASGVFHSADGRPTATEVDEAQRELLLAWKRNQPELIRRFDTNHDGQVDMQEWEAARAEARRTALNRLSARQNPTPVNMLTPPGDGRKLIIDARPRVHQLRTLRQLGTAAILFAVVYAALGSYGIELRMSAAARTAARHVAP